MATGASAAKRKAKKAAAEQYYNSFSKVKPVEDYSKVASGNLRSVDDEIGNASSTSRNQARKLDSLAHQIKSNDELSRYTKLYNARYDILKQQIAGANSNPLYSVSNAPTGGNGILSGQSSGLGQQSSQPTGMADIANMNKTPKLTIDVDNTYATKDEAIAAAERAMNAYNASIKSNPQQKAITDPNSFIQEKSLPKFGILYRNLNVAEDAAADLNNISEKINSTAGSAALQQYSSIAEQLRKRLEKEASGTIQSPAATAQPNELASASPYTETIR